MYPVSFMPIFNINYGNGPDNAKLKNENKIIKPPFKLICKKLIILVF